VLPYGEVWIGVDEDDVVSVALWMPPSTASPASVLNEIAIERATLEGARHEASVKAETFVSRLRPTTARYYLGAVGTRRDRQQRGHGAAVLTPMLDRADAEDAQVFLETSAIENVHFYLGLGFVTVAEVDVPEGGPHVWAMVRPHREATAER
jgi:predicted GNAT family N-acyltransferase